MVNPSQPQFPIEFHWVNTGEIEAFDSIEDIELNIEDFDSDLGEAIVKDALGRTLRLRVSLLNVEAFSVKQ
jgi:hypothetical protein